MRWWRKECLSCRFCLLILMAIGCSQKARLDPAGLRLERMTPLTMESEILSLVHEETTKCVAVQLANHLLLAEASELASLLFVEKNQSAKLLLLQTIEA